MSIEINQYFVIFLIVFLLRNVFELILQPTDKHKNNSEKDGKITIVVYTVLFLGSGTAVWIYLLFDPQVKPLVYYSGVVLLVMAFILRMITLQRIKRSFSLYINTLPSDLLITDGVYKIIRHPAYTFYSLEMLAFVVIKFNYFSLIALALDVLITLRRINKEEEFLLQRFGDKYSKYRKETKKLIPFVY